MASATPANQPLFPLTTHVSNINFHVTRDHKQQSAIMLVRNLPGFKQAVLAFRDDLLRVKNKFRGTTMLAQLLLFFVDNVYFQRLFDTPDFFDIVVSIHDNVDLSNADDVPALAGFLRLYNGLHAIKDAREAPPVKEAPKPKTTPRKRVIKSPKMVVDTDSDSEGETRTVGVKRKANDAAIEPSSLVKRFRAGVSSYEPGTSAADLLIAQVDTLLTAAGTVPKSAFSEYIEKLDRTTRLELFELDVLRQSCANLLERRAAVEKIVGSPDPRTLNVPLPQVTALSNLVAPPVPDEDADMTGKPADSA
ncbi:hypothetical protein H0H93_015913 [Arthromyces matolae]|nr:hypothetical protein H0H93_015913 [Arthromyces matolae]